MTKKDIEIIKQDEVATEVMADAIVSLSDAVKKLLDGPLNRRAVVVLIQDAMGGRNAVSRDGIEAVLDSAASLKEKYLVKGYKRKVEL